MENSRGFERGPSRRLPRTLTAGTFQDVMDPEVVPSSLAKIAPILRVANEIEDRAPRVAYLCRFYAFDRAHKLDQYSNGRGVRQFKTALLHKLEMDDEPTQRQRTAKTDAREMQNFYQEFYDTYVKSLESSTGDIAQLAKTFQTAAVLFDVLRATSPEPLDSDKAKDVETKKKIFVAYNVLPPDPGGANQAIMLLPEVKAAVAALRNTRGLELEKDNVSNQREHLIQIRQIPKPEPQNKLSGAAVNSVMKRLFKSYKQWCKFLGRKSNSETSRSSAAKDSLYGSFSVNLGGSCKCCCSMCTSSHEDLLLGVLEDMRSP